MSTTTPTRSPHLIREQEKKDLQFLNTKLENYVLHSSSLAAERDRLATELSHIQAFHAREKQELITKYEAEITILREENARLRDRQSSLDGANVKLQRELELARVKADDLKSVKRERDRLSADVIQLREELERATAELISLRKDNEDLNKKYPAALSEIDSLRSRLSSVQDELQKSKDFLKDSVLVWKAELKRYEDAAAARLVESRREWDSVHSSQLRRLQDELKAQQDAETKDLIDRNKSLDEQVKRLTSELSVAASDAAQSRTEILQLIERIKVAETQSSYEINKLKSARASLESEVGQLRDTLHDKNKDFNDLMALNITLEAEIERYRKILETEYDRLGFDIGLVSVRDGGDDEAVIVSEPKALTFTDGKPSSSGGAADDEGSKGDAGKGKRRASVGGARKRTRKGEEAPKTEPNRKVTGRVTKEEDSVFERSTVVDTIVTRSVPKYNNGILVEVDLINERVDITNNTDSDIVLDGWKLTSAKGDQGYTFEAGVKLARGGVVTIWSGANAQTHHNPSVNHYAWTKRYIWNNNGDSAVLQNASGEVVQEVECTPVAASEVLEKMKGEGQCIIM